MLGGNLGSLLYGDVSVMQYDNTPIKFTAISPAVKKDHIQLKFFIFAQNIDRGYTSEQPH